MFYGPHAELLAQITVTLLVGGMLAGLAHLFWIGRNIK